MPEQLLMRRPHLDHLPPAPPLPEGYEVRPFGGPDDLPALAGTLAAAFAEEWDEARVRRVLTEAPDVRAVYVAAWRGRPVATASSRWLPERYPGAGVVHWVGTHPDHARRGLGAAVVARVLVDFVDRGDPAAMLETDDHRLPAIRVYLGLGFLPVYDVRGEDHRPRWSAIAQALFGGQQPPRR